jgi:hypothetical protein
MLFAMVAWSVGCAEFTPPDDPDGSSKIIPVACSARVVLPDGATLEAASRLSWELEVSPTRIQSGEPFTATLDGVVVVDETVLDLAQTAVPGGVTEVNLVDLNATVHVRSGAAGDDVTLTTEPIPYRCDEGRAACDPASDDLSGVPGRRSNTDCQPEETTNPCGRFVPMPTSSRPATAGLSKVASLT